MHPNENLLLDNWTRSKIPLATKPYPPHIYRQSITHHIQRLLVRKTFLMAKKTKSELNNNFGGVTFVNYSLTADEIKKAKAWITANQADVETLLDTHIKAGYKTSIRYDQENECFIFSSTGTDDTGVNNKKCISSRSDVLVEAMMLQLFKVDILFNGGEWEGANDRMKWG